MSDKQILFLYGSLMRGLANHNLLSSEVEFIAEGLTEPTYSLLDLGPYPGAVAGGRSALHGELYAVPRGDLPRLDAFEGVPSFYHRVRTTLDVPEGTAWIYLLTTLPYGAAYIPSGSWRQCLEAR